ncbi:hypothetical protein GCM10020367_70610 [Streptomyces sannanensis]|uniref:PASTA domain-containing protein n=1 Tax=Streptomyces sannanensis TaxID=285536 RepID=A0ABP6SNJ1_9ACTN
MIQHLRLSRFVVPAAAVVAGVLALTACESGTQADSKAAAPTAITTSSAPSASSTAQTAVIPVLQGETYGQVQEELVGQDLPAVRITATALHKDVTLPTDHSDWHICEISPAPGTKVTATTTVTVKLAQKAGDCATSFHGYLHQKNDPAYTPPTTSAPQPVKSHTPAPTKTTTRPAGSSMTTCPDGKQGYACTSNGHPVVDGQFCPNADRGRTLKATNGTMVTCSYDPSVKPYRWQ